MALCLVYINTDVSAKVGSRTVQIIHLHSAVAFSGELPSSEKPGVLSSSSLFVLCKSKGTAYCSVCLRGVSVFVSSTLPTCVGPSLPDVSEWIFPKAEPDLRPRVQGVGAREQGE